MKPDCILVIDDNEIDRWVIRRILEIHSIGSEIITAFNGKDGLEKLSKYYDKHHSLPDMIITDVRMPLMDGFEFLNRLFKTEYFSPSQTKIIILTATEDTTDIEKLRGMHIPPEHILLKPLDIEQLKRILI